MSRSFKLSELNYAETMSLNAIHEELVKRQPMVMPKTEAEQDMLQAEMQAIADSNPTVGYLLEELGLKLIISVSYDTLDRRSINIESQWSIQQ